MYAFVHLINALDHAQQMHELPDTYLADILPLAKRVAKANGDVAYNVLQNNGRLAHQEVMHVHFHVIPKRDGNEGLGLVWNPVERSKDALQQDHKVITERIAHAAESDSPHVLLEWNPTMAGTVG
jgi:diadenosine tetraphosphate (Ap4A) HIT family hydrolase